MDNDLSELHGALLDLVGVLNRPRPDRVLLDAAGVGLDRALFPLLVRIAQRGPLGVVELAEMSGRDHSTVSRQIAKLESLGLVERRAGSDRRVRAAQVTARGRAMTDDIARARNQLMSAALADWPSDERRELARLVRKLADRALAWSAADDASD